MAALHTTLTCSPLSTLHARYSYMHVTCTFHALRTCTRGCADVQLPWRLCHRLPHSLHQRVTQWWWWPLHSPQHSPRPSLCPTTHTAHAPCVSAHPSCPHPLPSCSHPPSRRNGMAPSALFLCPALGKLSIPRTPHASLEHRNNTIRQRTRSVRVPAATAAHAQHTHNVCTAYTHDGAMAPSTMAQWPAHRHRHDNRHQRHCHHRRIRAMTELQPTPPPPRIAQQGGGDGTTVVTVAHAADRVMEW